MQHVVGDVVRGIECVVPIYLFVNEFADLIDYIIVGKPTSSGYWQVMSSTIDANGRWAQVSTTISYNTSIDITDSSVDFPGYSINTYRFIVEKYDGGYVLKNYTSGNYVTYAGSGNAGAEVAPGMEIRGLTSKQ